MNLLRKNNFTLTCSPFVNKTGYSNVWTHICNVAVIPVVNGDFYWLILVLYFSQECKIYKIMGLYINEVGIIIHMHLLYLG